MEERGLTPTAEEREDRLYTARMYLRMYLEEDIGTYKDYFKDIEGDLTSEDPAKKAEAVRVQARLTSLQTAREGFLSDSPTALDPIVPYLEADIAESEGLKADVERRLQQSYPDDVTYHQADAEYR